jgi:anthranilate phosphoribosyltransferase
MERIEPEDLGLRRAGPAALSGGDALRNAALMERLLGGADGPMLEATLLNAAAALLVAGAADSLADGLAQARRSVASGKAGDVLARLRRRGKG